MDANSKLSSESEACKVHLRPHLTPGVRTHQHKMIYKIHSSKAAVYQLLAKHSKKDFMPKSLR